MGVLSDQSQVFQSPRGTFPTDLGTDGQRLRANKASTKTSSALNYIGKLFFLTSDRGFLSIWDDLKSGKITVKKALELANELAQSR